MITMRSNTMKAATISRPSLRVVKGYLNANAEVQQLVDSAWNFAYNSLWSMTIFSTKEIDAAKARIHEYLTLAKSPRKAFLSFCQRVLLARHYISQVKGRYIPLPSVWLDKDNQTGFAGTKNWFSEIKAVRESLPNYKQEIKALAEAVLEFSDEPSVQNYQYWRQYFIEKGTPGLLNLFQVTAIQQLCN
jgi:hypothetical protein